MYSCEFLRICVHVHDYHISPWLYTIGSVCKVMDGCVCVCVCMAIATSSDIAYSFSLAKAEQMVLSASCPELETIVVRTR